MKQTKEQMNRRPLNPDHVVDTEGRRRFHGAFTGGFSAGYYNSAGSAEGWQPKQFVSSRSQKANYEAQSIHNFMDEEDGLIGGSGKLAVNQGFSKEGGTSTTAGSSLVPFRGLIQAPKESIGIKMLQLAGWRQGQAIGPRIRLKELPQGLERQSIPQHALDDDNCITVALREDTTPISHIPKPKTDLTCLGYDPALDNNTLRHHRPITDPTSSQLKKQRRYNMNDIFEKSNDDYYMEYDEDNDLDYLPSTKLRGNGQLLLSNEEIDPEEARRLPLPPSSSSAMRSITNYIHSDVNPSQQQLVAVGGHSSDPYCEIPLFISATKLSEDAIAAITKSFAAIEVPKDYEPRHIFEGAVGGQSSNPSAPTVPSATDAKLPQLSFLSAKEKEVLQSRLKAVQSHPQSQSQSASVPTATVPLNSNFSKLSEAFRSRFVTSTSTASTHAIVPAAVGLSSVEEYSKLHSFASPPSASTAAATATATVASVGGVVPPLPVFKPVRTSFLWLPEKLLCKRYNVPVPEAAALSSSTATESVPVKSSYEHELFESNIGQYMSDPKPLPSSQPPEPTVEIQTYEIFAPKPSKSLFQSIFDDSDEEDEEEEVKEVEQPKEKEKEGKTVDIPTAEKNSSLAVESDILSSSRPVVTAGKPELSSDPVVTQPNNDNNRILFRRKQPLPDSRRSVEDNSNRRINRTQLSFLGDDDDDAMGPAISVPRMTPKHIQVKSSTGSVDLTQERPTITATLISESISNHSRPLPVANEGSSRMNVEGIRSIQDKLLAQLDTGDKKHKKEKKSKDKKHHHKKHKHESKKSKRHSSSSSSSSGSDDSRD